MTLQSSSRLILLTLLAAGACALSLEFHFPGYFDPLAIYHPDHFHYVGLHHESASVSRYFMHYPRPFGYVLLHYSGMLGVDWLFAPMFVASLLNLALVTRYVERVMGRRVGLGWFAFYAALVFGNPEWYWGIKNDPLAVFSLTFLLVGVHCWQSYIETPRNGFLVAAAMLLLLSTQIKESYLIVLAVFLALQLYLHPERRRAVAALLFVCGVFALFAVYRASSWASASGLVYSRSLAPADLIRSFATLGAGILVPGVAALIVVVLAAAWWRDRAAWMLMIVSLVFAILSLTPNAMLPQHLYLHYAALGLPFLFAPVLLLDRLIPPRYLWQASLAALSVVLYAMILVGYQPNIQGSAGWQRDQELIGDRLVGTLEEINSKTSPGESVLVMGLMMAFHPYYVADFVAGEMCAGCRWTVIVPDAIAERRTGPIRLIHESNPAALEPYDRFVLVAPDGTLAASSAGIGKDKTADANRSTDRRPRLFASPNPVRGDSAGLATTTLHWSVPTGAGVEIRVGAPGGTLFAAGASSGNAETGQWVRDGATFFLQDASTGDPTSSDNTLAIVRVSVTRGDAK